ncbi:MAG: sulfatase-like hydrolase/transferase [Bryobacteraceae bacterium]|nr:sulfatase-like hydrolase/transferase [Bryobacteraceae bacterium]
MTRRQFVGQAAMPVLAAAQTPRPNVVLIMSDDQGYGDLSLHGNPHLQTPNLDKLGRQGVQFSRFYVSPVCAPTRASLLTGRYHLRSGVHGVTTGRETMRPNEVTIAEALKPAGYRTGLIGKWHLGENYPYVPHAQGFDEFIGFRTGHWTEYWNPPLERNGVPFRAEGFIADVFTDEAIRFVEANAQRRFFLYLAYNTPHSPYLAPERYWEQYRSLGLPPQVAAVYSMVANLDENIGRFLQSLDRLDLASNTVVMFLTDNGPNGQRYNAGMRGAKGSVYEGGVRVPFFIRWPRGFEGGREIDRIAGAIDVLPTVLDLCELRRPPAPPLDGVSLVPLLEGAVEHWPERMLFTHRGERDNPGAMYNGAVRTQRYNLVNGTELYDVLEDPGEKDNIAAGQPEVAAKLRAAYERWFKVAASQCGFSRPVVPVGYSEENPARLTAAQSYLTGGVTYSRGNGFAHEWVSNWKSPADAVHWEVEIVRPGRYEISARYLCPAADTGSKVRLTIAGRTLEAVVDTPTSMEPATHRDLIPRTLEAPQMDWGTLTFGSVQLPAGRAQLRLQAVEKPGAAVMELEAIELKR